jgi:sec-independent protein translocase protein TatA
MPIGPPELIVLAVVALLVLGPKRLPDAGRSLGRGMREFKESLSGETAKSAGDRASTEPPPLEPGRPEPSDAVRRA